MVGELSLPERGARLELFVRSSVPSAARECRSTVVDRLRALDDTEGVERVAVRRWQKRVSVDEEMDEAGKTRDAYAAFAEWADEQGADLHPFFETRACYSSVTGETHTALVLPVACLAVSEGERLRGVFPHASEGRTYTVSDALDALETADRPEVSPGRR